jgi:glycosyltransferase involved in cell wall biosynthesis
VTRGLRVAHLTTVDSSLWYLLRPQLRAVLDGGGEVLGISAPGPDVARLEADGVRHLPLASSSRGWGLRADLRAAYDLWRLLRRERPDVLHTHNPKPGLYGRVVGRLTGVPVVVNTVHGLYVRPGAGWRNAVVLALEAVAATCSDAELVQNEEDLDLLRRRRLVRRGQARLLGNGVDLRRFRPPGVAGGATVADADLAAKERAEARSMLGVTDDDLVLVGAVGRLVAEKGFPELFAAAARLRERFGDRVEVVVVGPDDPAKPDRVVPAQCADAQAAGVRFLGHRDDVDLLYRGLDVFVLASHREGFPRAAMEAAASGVPVVATDIRGCRQVVEDDVTGLLVPVRDPAALAAAIGDLVEDPARRAAMGAAAAARARTDFDEQQVVGTVLATYAEVAARKGVTAALRVPAH